VTRKEFPASVKKSVRERSKGTCEVHLIPDEMRRVRYPALPASCNRKAKDIDHIHGAWSDGDTTIGNAAHLCDPCHAIKTVTDNKEAKKSNRIQGITGQRARRERNGPTIRQPKVSALSKHHQNYRKPTLQGRKMGK
jgi:5-methylcytosine-specific restriction endonuclease McrA